MPFWKRSSPEDEQRRSQALQDAEASRRSLEAGGLPLQAQRRLSEEVQAGHPLFTSDLSVKEFSLVRNQGYTALSQVMGSSIYQVGWQFTRNFSWNTTAYELTNVSNAHQHAAQLALGRLEQEAALLRAHGVIGVRLNTRDYEWGQNLLEYTAIGTAIRLENTPLPSRPFLSDLSGQEFWTLLQAGYYPDGVVTGFCSYYVSLGSQATRQLNSWFGGGWTNQEIVPFSQGLYTARSLAMDRLLNMARRLNAIGVVGMHIHSNRRLIEQESNETKYMDFSVQFSAVGTAINALRKDHVIPAPQPTLTFTDLRPGRRGETSELTIKG
ncbi:MAG: heavy metal-binding domain-containing protein [Chloroflexi bacterium]|nr:MAG: heavy metal-binding domain-containing protein [Chloroflexota bacterium]